MTRTRRHLYRSFPLLLLALTAATSAQAADNYLKVIPGSALAWGAVNHMNEASDKIQKLATVVQAPTVSVLEQMKKETGLQKGVDEKGAAGFFVVPGKTEKDAGATAMFVAVADEKEFLGNFVVVKAGEKISEVRPRTDEKSDAKPKAIDDINEVKPQAKPKTKGATASAATSCLAFRDGYALIAPKSDRMAVEAAIEAKQSIAAEMAGLESWLAENDGTVVGTAAGIKFAAKQASEELKKSKAGSGGGRDAVMGDPLTAMMHSYLDLYRVVPEAASAEISLAVAGIRCDNQSSIRVIGRARLVNGGLVSKFFATIPPVTDKLLSGVPGGSFVIAAGGVNMPKLVDAYASLMTTALTRGIQSTYGMSAADAERLGKQSIEVFRQIRSLSFVMRTGKRGDPMYSNMFSAMHVDSSQRFLELQEKNTESVNKLMQDAKQGVIKSMTAKRLEIAGKPALQQEMNFDLSSMAGAGTDRAVLDEVLGVGGKMLLYQVAADEHTVIVGIGVSQERMVAALDIVKQPRKSLAEDGDVSATAAMLPPSSQWVAYISPYGYMQLTQRMMAVAMKNQPQAMGFSMPPFPRCPPIGFAVEATPAELHAEIAIPASLVRATGEYSKDMQKMFMDRSQQNQTPVP